MPQHAFTHRQRKKMAEDGKKWCPSCEKVLSVDKFHKNPSTASGFGSHCGKCKLRYKRKKQPTKKSLIEDALLDIEIRLIRIEKLLLEKTKSAMKTGSQKPLVDYYPSQEELKELFHRG